MMKKNDEKQGFLIYKDNLAVLKRMSREQAGDLFFAINAYLSGDEAELDRLMTDQVVAIAFTPFMNNFIRDGKKWEDVRLARQVNGRKGGLQRSENLKKKKNSGGDNVAKASKPKQTAANQADNGNDTGNGNGNGNDTDTVSTNVDDKERHTGVCPKKDGLSLPPSPPEKSDFEKFNAWLRKNCPNVLKLQTQMTEAQYDKLIEKKYTKTEICEALEDLNNWKDFPDKRTNVYRSTLDELRKKYGEKK